MYANSMHCVVFFDIVTYMHPVGDKENLLFLFALDNSNTK